MLTLPVLIDCNDDLRSRARYTLDSLLMAAQIVPAAVDAAPTKGPWLLYSADHRRNFDNKCCVRVPHCPQTWDLSVSRITQLTVNGAHGVPVLGSVVYDHGDSETDLSFDLLGSAFYFLASCGERTKDVNRSSRGLYESSVYTQLGIPQNIVDLYLNLLLSRIDRVLSRTSRAPRQPAGWPRSSKYAVVLSHDVDFLAESAVDTIAQAGRTALRHLFRQRAPLDASKALAKFAKAIAAGRDPFCDLAGIIAREKAMDVSSSFQIAVGHRHPADVNYHIDRDATRRKLAQICEQGFEVALHGSVRSTEQIEWYVAEATKLSKNLSNPIGSRQHFLSFAYDSLFQAQERAGIQFDMSMGYPDCPGPRAGFSFPYFPYSLEHDRPFDVVEIGLSLMDVTLRSYLDLKNEEAWKLIDTQLDYLEEVGGCLSVVWHPIVFGGARDPGMDELFWRMVERIGRSNGLATDGRTINACVRERARMYPSFESFAG